MTSFYIVDFELKQRARLTSFYIVDFELKQVFANVVWISELCDTHKKLTKTIFYVTALDICEIRQTKLHYFQQRKRFSAFWKRNY